jgi:hypothetical protein
MLHVTWVDVAPWFFPCCNVAKVDLDVCGVLFFECCGCCFWMLRNSFTMLHAIWFDVATRFFFYFSFLALQWRIWRAQLIWRLCARPEARVSPDVWALATPNYLQYQPVFVMPTPTCPQCPQCNESAINIDSLDFFRYVVWNSSCL